MNSIMWCKIQMLFNFHNKLILMKNPRIANGRNNNNLQRSIMTLPGHLSYIQNVEHKLHKSWASTFGFLLMILSLKNSFTSRFASSMTVGSSSVDLSIVIQACFLLGLNLYDTFIEILMVHLIIPPKKVTYVISPIIQGFHGWTSKVL